MRLSPLVALLALLGAAVPAHAQDTRGFALDRYDPAAAGSDWFALDSLDLRGSLRPAVGLTLDYGRDPLVVYNLDGTKRSAIVRDQLFAHLGASVVLADRLRLSLNLPVALYQSGDEATVNGIAFQAASSAALGDPRVGVDVRLVGVHGEPFTLAVGVDAFIPVGSQTQYAGDGKIRLAPHLLAAGQAAFFEYGASLGFTYRGQDAAIDGSPFGSEVNFGASAGVRPIDALLIGPELYGVTGISSGAFFSRRTSPLELLLGAHVQLSDFKIGAGFGPGLTQGIGSPEYRGLLSLAWAPAYEAPDRDHDGVADDDDACPDLAGVKTSDPRTNGCPADGDRDGIPDLEDACPTVKGVRTSNPRTNGCPPPPPDRDHDGVIDARDACPDVPGVKTSDRTTNGCPPPPADTDHDGVVDPRDACPKVAGVKTNDPRTNGCPPDRDHDGVADAEDACPDLPGDRTSDPKTNGCPTKDTDGDTVPDYLDNCPTVKGPPSNQGCPAKQKQLVVITREKIEIKDKVFFATGKATIKKQSFGLLDQVASVITSHPDIPTILVEGHTDDRGGAELNRKLSQARAESVRTYLIKKGVDAGRLEAKGYGPDRPIDTNKTSKGRANNRRVEFRIVSPEKVNVDLHDVPATP